GELTIEAMRNEKNAIIRLTDTGVGFSEEGLANAFSPFYSTKTAGTGLGLAVAKRLIEAQGGSITASSEQGKGSVFTVEVPLAN
ncbi:ATP-binding protein, partial [Candidatus Bathyarchaeota archaeon]|nr:ATP-binding protein [Candidatus Bathyarchaeota archaeon]